MVSPPWEEMWEKYYEEEFLKDIKGESDWKTVQSNIIKSDIDNLFKRKNEKIVKAIKDSRNHGFLCEPGKSEFRDLAEKSITAEFNRRIKEATAENFDEIIEEFGKLRDSKVDWKKHEREADKWMKEELSKAELRPGEQEVAIDIYDPRKRKPVEIRISDELTFEDYKITKKELGL